MTVKKKRTRRNKTKYPALNPELNLKSRYEEIVDIASYADKLSEKDKEWLNAFTEEYVNANFNHNGPKIHKKKAQKKEIYTRNNARNRDVWTKAKASGTGVYLEDIKKEKDLERESRSHEELNNLNEPNDDRDDGSEVT